MKNLVAFNGSPRKNGNSSILLGRFLEGVGISGAQAEGFNAHDIKLEYCKGCLRCNILGRCSIESDDWPFISKKILDADILIFASPIYFHHVTAPLKKLLDRFRSFVHVQITETGLTHTPHNVWEKDVVLLLCMGSSDVADAKPVIEIFEFITSMLGNANKIHVVIATRLAIVKQVLKTAGELKGLYQILNIPEHLAEKDFIKNQETLNKCFHLGKDIVK